jgi:ribosome-binding ATPase
MPAEEAAEWLDMLGVAAGEGGGLASLIRASYSTLGLQTYFTTGAGRAGGMMTHDDTMTHSYALVLPAQEPKQSSTNTQPRASRVCHSHGMACAGEKETRAWTIKQGMTAPQAAGVIHSDFERGFIRAGALVWLLLWRACTCALARHTGARGMPDDCRWGWPGTLVASPSPAQSCAFPLPTVSGACKLAHCL